jgi:hypothetical protein
MFKVENSRLRLSVERRSTAKMNETLALEGAEHTSVPKRMSS